MLGAPRPEARLLNIDRQGYAVAGVWGCGPRPQHGMQGVGAAVLTGAMIMPNSTCACMSTSLRMPMSTSAYTARTSQPRPCHGHDVATSSARQHHANSMPTSWQHHARPRNGMANTCNCTPATSGQLHGNDMATTLQTTRPGHDYDVANNMVSLVATQLQRGSNRVKAGRWHGHDMATHWRLHGNNAARTWQRGGSDAATTWQSYV